MFIFTAMFLTDFLHFVGVVTVLGPISTSAVVFIRLTDLPVLSVLCYPSAVIIIFTIALMVPILGFKSDATTSIDECDQIKEDQKFKYDFIHENKLKRKKEYRFTEKSKTYLYYLICSCVTKDTLSLETSLHIFWQIVLLI